MRQIDHDKNDAILKLLLTRDATASQIRNRCMNTVGSIDTLRGRLKRLGDDGLIHVVRYDIDGNNWSKVWRYGPGLSAISPRGWPGGDKDGKAAAQVRAGRHKWPFPPAPLLAEVLGLIVLCDPPKGRVVRGSAMRG